MYRYIILLCALLIAGCTKHQTVSTTTPAPGPETGNPITPNTYEITGIRDIKLKGFSSKESFILNAALLTGTNSKIGIAIDKIPYNVLTNKDLYSSATPFSKEYTFHSIMSRPGSYKSIIKTIVAGKTIDEYPFNITITPTPYNDCQELFYKAMYKPYKWLVYDDVNHELYFTNLGVRTTGSSFSQVYYDYQYRNNAKVKLVIDCDNNTLTIPPTDIIATGYSGDENFTIEGYGKVYPDEDSSKYIINYSCTSEGNIINHTLQGYMNL